MPLWHLGMLVFPYMNRLLINKHFLLPSLDFVIWFVPSLVGNAVVVSIIGLLLGPMYPIAMNQASRILPPWILTGSIGWIAGFGQAGSALLPFLTGAIADKHGIQSLHPLYVTLPLLLQRTRKRAYLQAMWYWLIRSFSQLGCDDGGHDGALLVDAQHAACAYRRHPCSPIRP